MGRIFDMGKHFRRYGAKASNVVSFDLCPTCRKHSGPGHECKREDIIATLDRPPDFQSVPNPLPLLLNCPSCGFPHVDTEYWRTHLHKTHLCASCRHEWRPCEFFTIGVAILPFWEKK